MSIRVIRSHEFYRHHLFSIDDAVSMGLEKAIVLHNIHKKNPENTVYELFPFISHERVDQLIQELINEGLIQGCKNE